MCLLCCVDDPPSPEEPAPAALSSVSTVTNTNTSSGGNGELGEDMLQMALRMASEMTEEPVLDLEDNVDPAPVRRGVLIILLYVVGFYLYACFRGIAKNYANF